MITQIMKCDYTDLKNRLHGELSREIDGRRTID